MDCSTPGFPVLHPIPELAQTHAHQVGDVIQPSHPLSFPSPPAFNLSQHQGLFQWVSSSSQVASNIRASASVLPVNIQHWVPLGLTGSSPHSPRDSKESSPTSQLKSINSSVLSFLHSPTLTSIPDHWKNHSLDEQWETKNNFLKHKSSQIMKCLGINLTKYVQDLYAEIYIILKKELNAVLNKWRDILC